MHAKLNEIAELWAQGVITEEIARRLDMTKGSVCRLARDARLKGDLRFPARGRFDMRKRQYALIPPAPTPKVNPMLVDLKPNECKWPVRSEGQYGDLHFFCAETRAPSSPYCDEHAMLSTNRTHVSTWVRHHP